MANTTQVAARLQSDLVRQIDATAAEDSRTRTDQLEWLARIGLAGRARLKQLEEQAIAGITRTRKSRSTAAADHLREHARLGGFDKTNQENTDP